MEDLNQQDFEVFVWRGFQIFGGLGSSKNPERHRHLDGALIEKFSTRSVGNFSNTARLLRYTGPIFVFDIRRHFKEYGGPSCDTFFNRRPNLERQLTISIERVKGIYSKNVYDCRGTLFYKLDSFGMSLTDNQKLHNSMTVFVFESVSVEGKSFRDTETSTWIWEPIPFSASNSSNLIRRPIFLRNSNVLSLVTSFLDAMKKLSTQSKPQVEMNFLQVETTVESKVEQVLELPKKRPNRSVGIKTEDNKSRNSSTQFLKTLKKLTHWLAKQFERNSNAIPVFGFNNMSYDISLIKRN